jgi:hypothetical protein
MDKKEYQRKKTSITYSKTKTEIRNNEDLEEEIKPPKKTIRNTTKNNTKTNKIDSADNQEDKTTKNKIEELKRCKSYRHEVTTRRDEEKKKIGNKNTTTKYDEEASNKLRKTLGIQKTPQSKQNMEINTALARTSELIQNNKENERKERKNNQEEIKVTSNKKDVTNDGDNYNMDTNTQIEGEEEEQHNNKQNNNRNKEDKNNNNNTSNNKSNNKKGDPDGRKQSNEKSVSIIDVAEMDTFTFTIGWNPKDYRGRDGKAVLRSLLRAILHKSPGGTKFHPTNRNIVPTPRDIHSVNIDFPNTPEEFDDFFDQTTNRNRSNYRIYMKAAMSHNEKELQQRMFNYLRHSKIYLNSPFIYGTRLEMAGFIENGHSRLLYRPNIKMKI